jgi:hypothetical protein
MSKKQKAPRARADLKALVRRLARVEDTTTAIARRDDERMITTERNLTAVPMLGSLGLVELKLTAKEEAVLSRPVDPAIVRIKPTGQPYISHPDYTRWFNEAFGRTGWALVPLAMPESRQDGKRVNVQVPYMLHVHQQPVAFAVGEAEYWTNSREQSAGDAVEATIASGLRRCAKRIGVGLELWDKRFLDEFLHKYGVVVPVMVFRDGQQKKSTAWRRRDDPALSNEITGPVREVVASEADEVAAQRYAPDYSHSEPAPARSSSSRPPAGNDGRGGDVISQPQNRRLFAILRNSGRNEQAFRAWLARRFGVESTADIKRRDYDFICQAVESSRALPERESGEEG